MGLIFYFDQTRCSGCYTCVIACKDWHDVPAGKVSWLRMITIEQGVYPRPFVAHLFSTCFHCAHPACAEACPAGAIGKRDPDNIVAVDREVCLGREACGACLYACPYDAPQFGNEEDPKMQKCNLCIERWAEGKKPVCVDSCPTRALDAGPADEMEARYGACKEAVGFSYDEKIRPSIIFKPKPEAP